MAPFFLQTMEPNTPEAKIESMLLPLLDDSDMFLVSIRIKPTNNIKVYVDADSGLSIGKCASINRKLYHIVEEAGLYPDGNFSLEVSSPGVDEPLRSVRQYIKNVGRTVEVTLLEGEPVLGKLQEVLEDKIIVVTKGTKKEPPKEVEIPMDFIKTVIVQVTF